MSGGAAFLFYRSPVALLLAIFIVPMYLKRKKKQYAKERIKRLQQQFQSGMQIVSGTLAAGYSMENAWKTAEKDLEKLYGKDAEFCVELNRMNQKIRMNQPMEQLLSEFAERSGCEDICNFAEIFRFAKRSGGNMTEIIRTTLSRMQEKADIMEEIQNAVAAKKAEQKMMNFLFPGILLFLILGSSEYVSTLYETAAGRLVMSICLAGYVIACLWSEKLMDIPV